MVPQMMDESKELGSVTSRCALPTDDKQNPISIKKVALRELPNEPRSIVAHKPGNSPFSKDSQAVFNSVKVYGTKRLQPECPSSPSTLCLPADNIVNGHLVYVRRKLDPGTVKISSCTKSSGTSQKKSRFSNDAPNEVELLQDQHHESKISSVPPLVPFPLVSPTITCPGKSISGLAVAEPTDSVVTTVKPGKVDPQQDTDQKFWKERFLRLQMYLKNCDESSQDDYIEKLRTLSAAGRSKHAVELEKRAIQLLLEEGKELHRMKVLNVLGKTLPKEDAPPPKDERTN